VIGAPWRWRLSAYRCKPSAFGFYGFLLLLLLLADC
jgi:hypothetical protein